MDSIELLSPEKISDQTDILTELYEFGIDHYACNFGWNYILDHVWLVQKIHSFLQDYYQPNPIVLDIGCGNSKFHNFVEKKFRIKILGIDRPEGYCHHREGKNVDFFVDFKNFHVFVNSSVDIIFWMSSLEHNDLDDIKLLIDKSLALLKPGGLFLATIPLSRETEWFAPSQQTNLSIQDAQELFGVQAIHGDYNLIHQMYQENCLGLKEKYLKRYGNFNISDPEFIIAGLLKTKSTTSGEYQKPSGKTSRPIAFIPSNDSHVHWMLPIANKFQNTVFITLPNLISENAELNLDRLNINYYRYSPTLLSKLQPAAAVFGNDWGTDEIAVINEAKMYFIPTICIQEGVIDFLSPGSKRMKQADFAFIHGEIMKHYLKRGRIVVTGNPKYDYLDTLPLPDETTVLINSNFTYGLLEEFRKTWIKSVAKACELMDLPFFISQHPRDEGTFPYDYQVINSNAFTVVDQLRKASIIITRFSTLIYEAICTGRQVIYYNPHGEDFGLLSSDETNTILFAKTETDLVMALKSAISRLGVNHNNNRTKFLQMHIGTVNRNSSDLCYKKVKAVASNFDYPTDYFYTTYIRSLSNSALEAAENKKLKGFLVNYEKMISHIPGNHLIKQIFRSFKSLINTLRDHFQH